jgi:hypothetical protein
VREWDPGRGEKAEPGNCLSSNSGTIERGSNEVSWKGEKSGRRDEIIFKNCRAHEASAPDPCMSIGLRSRSRLFGDAWRIIDGDSVALRWQEKSRGNVWVTLAASTWAPPPRREQ